MKKFLCIAMSLILVLVMIPTISGGVFAETSDYLCFTAVEDNSTIELRIFQNPESISLMYYTGSTPSDISGWKTYEWEPRTDGVNTTYGPTIKLQEKGDKVYFRASDTNYFSKDDQNYCYFFMEGKIAASGNIMSLLDSTCQSETIPCGYCFFRLFVGCKSLTEAPELPATTLAPYCYAQMFSGCTSLTDAPELLPATVLANRCYSEMFAGCKSLTEAPELPATTLASYCYADMFRNCDSLTTATELPSTTLADSCYMNMFSNCDSLTDAPELPATTLTDHCYYGMFSGCTSLTDAPELPAGGALNGLANYCYCSMFAGCTSLTGEIKLPSVYVVANNNPECHSYEGMFENCTNLEAVYFASQDMYVGNSENMFAGADNVKIIRKNSSGTRYNFGRGNEQNIIYIDKCTVNFIAGNKDHPISSTDVDFFGSITSPTNDPAVTHVTITDWFSDEECTNRFEFDSTPVLTNTNIYAQFEHGHVWGEYVTSSDASSFTASCTNPYRNTPCETVTVTLKADNVEYDGSAHGAYLENYDKINTGTGLITTTNITYYLEGGATPTNAANSGASDEGGAPVKVGKYVAKVAINGDFNLEKSFEIKAKPSNPGGYYIPTADNTKKTDEKIKEIEEKAALKEKIAAAEISMKSSQTKLNGYTAIKITWVIEGGDLKIADLDNYEIFRSTKKNSGYGKKPYFTSSKPDYGYYVNNKGLKKGKTYYYKVRGFKVIDGEKYYTPWSTKCWRTVK